MIEHPREDSDGTRFCSSGFQDFRGFRAGCAGGEDIIDDQDAFPPDGVRISGC